MIRHLWSLSFWVKVLRHGFYPMTFIELLIKVWGSFIRFSLNRWIFHEDLFFKNKHLHSHSRSPGFPRFEALRFMFPHIPRRHQLEWKDRKWRVLGRHPQQLPPRCQRITQWRRLEAGGDVQTTNRSWNLSYPHSQKSGEQYSKPFAIGVPARKTESVFKTFDIFHSTGWLLGDPQTGNPHRYPQVGVLITCSVKHVPLRLWNPRW